MAFLMFFYSLLAALIGTLIYAITIAIYRLTFHPLAKYPGPVFAVISHWDQVYHAWKGDRHLEFYRCHEKYGPVYRYGPNNLSFNTNTALQTIYGHKSNVLKSQFYSVFPAQKDAFSTHSAINKEAHARKRRVISHAFSDSAIRTMEKYILAQIRTFCDQVGQEGVVKTELVGSEKTSWTKPQNISDWCDYLTFDILGDLCFGKAFGMLERQENRFAVKLIGSAAQRHLICGCFPMIHELHLDKILFHKISAGRERYMGYSKSQAVERTKMGLDVDRKDFFYYLLNAKDPETGKGFSMSELWGESNLLLIAGSDTTSTALASSFFYLVQSPQTQLKKLRDEILETFGDLEDIIPGPKLNSCIYLRACVDEAMRLSPPVGGLLPREVQAGGLEIDGFKIPANVVVGTPIYTIHHNEAYFPNPFEFIPERWIPDHETKTQTNIKTTAETVAQAKTAYCPFSIGPRGCIGKGLAYTELLTAVARTVCLYEMRLAKGEKTGGGSLDGEAGRKRSGEFQLWDTFTSKKDGPMVEFSPRDRRS